MCGRRQGMRAEKGMCDVTPSRGLDPTNHRRRPANFPRRLLHIRTNIQRCGLEIIFLCGLCGWL